jgi:hypothetical protein
MAGQKATIDKDSSKYLSKTSSPDSERQTAYKSQKEVEGPTVNDMSNDRNGNGDDVFSGKKVLKDKSRRADQSTQGTAGDTYDTMDKATLEHNVSPFRKVLEARFRLSENENPGTAAAPASSDNPSLGMYSVNNSDFRQPKADVKGMLESIALQAAEAFEALNENNKVPDALASELDQCAKVIDKLYDYATNAQQAGSYDNSVPVENDPATMPVRRESANMNESKAGETYNTTTHSPSAVKPKKSKNKFFIKAESVSGEKFILEKMSKKKCKCAMQEMISSGSYVMVEMKKLSPKQKKIAKIAGNPNKIDAADLAALRAKHKMEEAARGVFGHLISE